MPSGLDDLQETPLARQLRRLLTGIFRAIVELILAAYIQQVQDTERAGRPDRKRRVAAESELEEGAQSEAE